jgi:hypothetical protein
MDKLVFLAALATTLITALETLSRVLQSRLQSQTHNRLLDKFSSAKDFADFLRSPARMRTYQRWRTDSVTRRWRSWDRFERE